VIDGTDSRLLDLAKDRGKPSDLGLRHQLHGHGGIRLVGQLSNYKKKLIIGDWHTITLKFEMATLVG
jgi:hypothetical protein